MPRFRLPLPGSISGLVMLVAALALLPALALIAYSDYSSARGELEMVKSSALASTRRIARGQAEAVERTYDLLFTLAQSPEVRGRDLTALQKLFDVLTVEAPMYADIRLHDRLGELLVSARARPGALSATEYQQVKLAAEGDTFAIYELPHENAYDKPVMHCLYPVRQDGMLLGILAAPVIIGFHPSQINGVAEQYLNYLYLADVQGHVVFGYPTTPLGSAIDGHHMEPAWRLAMAAPEIQGRLTPSENERVFFEKLFIDKDGQAQMTVLFSMSTPAMYARMQSTLVKNALFLLGATTLALLIARYFCWLALLKPIRRLLEVAARIREGDLSARMDKQPFVHELQLLADSVNSMAHALETRSNDLIAASRTAQAANEAKSSFLATMSHEIRTPMNAILGMTYLTRQGELSPHQRGYMDNIYDQAGKLLEIINDILDFSKIETGKLHLENIPFSPQAVLVEATGPAKAAAAKKNLAFRMDITPYLPQRLLGDALHLRQVLHNILGNAIKYTDKGEVGINCMVERTNPPEITLVFRVTDTAGGLSLEERMLLFPDAEQEALAATYEDGSHLNIAVTRKLVRLMQGVLHVDSYPGQGSAVTIRVPFAETQEPLPDDAAMPPKRHANALLAPPKPEQTAAQEQGPEKDAEQLSDKAPGLAPAGEQGVKPADQAPPGPEQQREPAPLREEKKDGNDAEEEDSSGFRTAPASPPPACVAQDKGTPASSTEPAPPSAPGRDAAPGPGAADGAKSLQGFHILLVEDNFINQQVAEEILTGLGATVSTASNGREALEVLERNRGGEAFHVALMDLQMPEMDGFAASEQIRKIPELRDMPIIAMSAQSRDEEWERCKGSGMNDFTAKPVDVPDLVATLRYWVLGEARHPR
ncbi:response regulator [Desulfovibrio sp. OttesenSCG-928-A18]|nr:response regulator [Desulfovibrio sp. OttesenSCG-928-A18]